MNLSLLREIYAVIKLMPNEPIPDWVSCFDSGLRSITYTADELSIVCKIDKIPEGLEQLEKPWRCLKVDGILDFSLTGILHMLTKPLAEHKISIFALSTYNTDYLLVKSESIDKAIQVLIDEGHTINRII